MTKEQIREIAKTYYFDVDDKLIDILSKDISKFNEKIKLFDSFDLKDVKPTWYCVSTSCNSLRKDVPVVESNPDEIAKNAKNKLDRHILVK